jgi:hypothetical protein
MQVSQISPVISQHRRTLIPTFLLLAGLALTPAALAGQQNDRDITREELLNFDRFLDSHQAIEQDLEKNPALVNDANYIKDHPELKTFLETHPGVREEVRENPRVFLRREERFDQSGRDITRPELANFDRFLDAHPGIEQDLRKDPRLLDSGDYLRAHPDLKTFLDTHPNVREEARENPRVFVRREEHFDKSGGDINRQEVARFDEFLDSHPQITHELAKDPTLIKNPEYLQKHPELNEFLGQHPRVRKDITQNPRVFMRAERRYEKREHRQRQIRERKASRPKPRPKSAAGPQA